MKKNIILGLITLSALSLSHQAFAGAKSYTFSSFKETGKGNCVDKTDISFNANVTKVIFDGKNGSKKPSTLTLSLGNKSDDTTPTGSDGNWAGSSNSFNGSGTRSGSLKLLITKTDEATCDSYNGTSVKFEN